MQPAAFGEKIVLSAKAVTPTASELLPALTGVRFFLALWVVLHHLTSKNMMLEPWVRTIPPALATVIRGGYLAVGWFFVLSGFVLARRYGNTTWTKKALYRYGVSRFARIYPVYALSLMLIGPIMVMDFRPAWIANYLLLLQGWVEKPAVYWNTPAWSLSCELFFYLCFPLAVFLFRTGTWGGVVAVGSAACMLTAVFRSFGMPEDWKPLLHFSDFLIGIAAADVFDLMTRSKRGIRLNGQWLYLPAAAIAIVLIAQPSEFWRHTTLSGMLRPLNAIVLVGLALGGGVLARSLSMPGVMFLGKASYSMYILHIPLLWWWKFGDPINPLSREMSALFYTLTVIAISGAVYHWYEEPANHKVRTYLIGR